MWWRSSVRRNSGSEDSAEGTESEEAKEAEEAAAAAAPTAEEEEQQQIFPTRAHFPGRVYISALPPELFRFVGLET